MTSAGSPRFSLISAVYGVAGFLEDFIASIEKQTFPLDRVQVVMVDDGSADGSAEILQQWAARRPELVTVLTQANAGQAAARNLGGNLYAGSGLTTIPAIQNRWAPSGADNDPTGLNNNWVRNVSTYYAELGGDPSTAVFTAGASTAPPGCCTCCRPAARWRGGMRSSVTRATTASSDRPTTWRRAAGS